MDIIQKAALQALVARLVNQVVGIVNFGPCRDAQAPAALGEMLELNTTRKYGEK